MILIIDNYDSFTWNIVHRCAEAAPGLESRVVRNDAITAEQALALHPSHIIISPGPCGPAEAGVSVELIRALAGRVPILGICLGHQCLGAAFNMQVVRHPPMHAKTCFVHHDGRGVFTGLPDPMEVMRYHSLVVQEESVPRDGWTVSAWTSDATGRVVMGLRRDWSQAPLEGVQFHPESFMTQTGTRMLARFLSPPIDTTMPPITAAPHARTRSL